jgi:uncharacterized membrane protein
VSVGPAPSPLVDDALAGQRRLIAGVFVAAGLAHFVVPTFFEAIVPPWLPGWLPSPRTVVHVSGAAELAGGVGVLVPAVRVAAGWGLLGLLIAVFPANVHMLREAQASGAPLWWLLALTVRLPLQGVLLWWVWRVVVHARRS